MSRSGGFVPLEDESDFHQRNSPNAGTVSFFHDSTFQSDCAYLLLYGFDIFIIYS